MNIESVSAAGAPSQQRPAAGDRVDQGRKNAKASSGAVQQVDQEKAKQAKDEILSAIRALTEEGLYSVRFEKHKATDSLVIKLVDREGEVIRQIPAEEILSLSEHLQDLRGNVIKTES